MKIRKNAFSLVEVMIVICILGLLAAIAIPNFIRARQVAQANACINSLRSLDAAKKSWAAETKADTNAIPSLEQIMPYLAKAGITNPPVCAADSSGIFSTSYSLNTVGSPPTCLVSTNLPYPHRLP